MEDLANIKTNLELSKLTNNKSVTAFKLNEEIVYVLGNFKEGFGIWEDKKCENFIADVEVGESKGQVEEGLFTGHHIQELYIKSLMIKVDKSIFTIDNKMSGYYSINGKVHGNYVDVFGGDSANEDDYNKEYIQEVLENWNGVLKMQKDWIGHENEYRIEV